MKKNSLNNLKLEIAYSAMVSLLATSANLPVLAADEISGDDSIRYLVETRATFTGGDHTPFWLVSNLSGLGSPEKNNGFVRGALFKDADRARRFSWCAGIDLVGAWRSQSPFYIHQLYAEVNYRSMSAMLGSKEIPGVLNNPRLSSGNLLYSGNALPIPQVRIGIFDYADFWSTDGWLAVKGYISYGMYTDSSWQKSWVAEGTKRSEGVLYHSKGLWLRGGKLSEFPLQGEIGIEMATQFGGKAFRDGKEVKMPSGFKSWWKALFPKYGTGNTLIGENVTSVEGNMLGAYNIAVSWLPQSDWAVKAYYEHYFEDQSQMTFEYGWKDGLWGLEIDLPDNPVVSTIVAEYLYTKDQTGAVNNDATDLIPEQVSGRDNYYSHSTYIGWQHWGMGIGNPLALSPIFNSDRTLTFRATRIQAWHFGMEGNPSPEIDWRLLLSYSRNWGTYTTPFEQVENNFNSLLEVGWTPRKLNGWYARAALAYDGGELLGKSFGAMITIGKTGTFRIFKKGDR